MDDESAAEPSALKKMLHLQTAGGLHSGLDISLPHLHNSVIRQPMGKACIFPLWRIEININPLLPWNEERVYFFIRSTIAVINMRNVNKMYSFSSGVGV